MKEVTIFQDGKICRHVPGTILRRSDKRIQIEFVISDFSDDAKPVKWVNWFKRRRRENGGVYECIGMNYWYYAKLNADAQEIVNRG